MERQTITLPNGYNGHTTQCYTTPILEDWGTTVRLQVADKGSEYMSRWVYRDQYDRLVNNAG